MIKLVLVRLAEGVLELIVAWRRGGARGVYAVIPADAGIQGHIKTTVPRNDTTARLFSLGSRVRVLTHGENPDNRRT